MTIPGAFWATLALVLALAGPVLAAADQGARAPCRPESLLTELDQKDPVAMRAILSAAASTANSRAMLWRVEREGIAASYLFGTLHIADESLTALSERALIALRGSRVVALESVQGTRKAVSHYVAQAGKIMTARDRPLQRLLDDDELRVVERSLMASGYPQELALGIKPWVATLFLASDGCHADGSASSLLKPLDLLVSDAAVKASIGVVGLETLLEQFEALAGIPESAQIAWLKASIATHDRADDVAHTMAELYRFRRIQAVWELTRAMAPKAGLDDATLAAIRAGLVEARNARLVERSAPLVAEGAAFIAVGALHLSGEDGLVAAYRNLGYVVRPIE